MTIDTNHNLANALLDRYDTEFPSTAVLEIRTGSPPGAQNAASGTLLVSFTLPASAWDAAASGVKALAAAALASNFTGVAAVGTGVAAHYRLRNAGDTRRVEGTVGLTGSGADLTLDNTNIVTGQLVSLTSFTQTLA